MRSRLRFVFVTALAVVLGVFLLPGLLVEPGSGALDTFVSTLMLRDIALLFIRLAAAIVVLSLFIGIINLLLVHLNRVLTGATVSARAGSVVLLSSFFAMSFVYMGSRSLGFRIYENVYLPAEAALAGLLFFALVWGAMRVMRRRTVARLLFVVTLVVVLLAAIPLTQLDGLREGYQAVLATPITAGVRGLLLGSALAVVVVGVRVFTGQDRF